MRKTLLLLVIFFQWFILAGCAAGAEVGYSPPIIIPIRISINTNGEIGIDLSKDWHTPIGTFDIGGGASVFDLRNQYANRLLIVRVDNQATVYELVEGREFKINFDDSNKLYKRVALEYETDGDIVLELESVKPSTLDSGTGGLSNTVAESTTIDSTVELSPTEEMPISTIESSPCSDVTITVTDTTNGDVLHIQQCTNWTYDAPPLAKGIYALDPQKKVVVYCTNTGDVYMIKVGDSNLALIESLKEKIPTFQTGEALLHITFYDEDIHHYVLFRDLSSGNEAYVKIPPSYFR